MEFYIFNTWGELLYKSESLEDLGWNGMHNGKPAQNGRYCDATIRIIFGLF